MKIKFSLLKLYIRKNKLITFWEKLAQYFQIFSNIFKRFQIF